MLDDVQSGLGRGFVRGSNSSWDADDSLDAALSERGFSRDDHPRAAVDDYDITNFRVVTGAKANAVGSIRPPQNHLERSHGLDLRLGDPLGPGGGSCAAYAFWATVSVFD
jgi:hypothetical protein